MHSEERRCGVKVSKEEVILMLWTIVAVLLILWLLGFGFAIAGGLIHILLVIALVLVVFELFARRRRA